MREDFLTKYSITHILENQSIPIAVTDINKKILWSNNEFKSKFTNEKTSDLEEALDLKIPYDLDSTEERPLALPLSNISSNLIITPLRRNAEKVTEAFLVEIIPIGAEVSEVRETDKLNKIFQDDLQEILILLLRESSLGLITEEIIFRCIKTTKSDFGIIIFHNENDKDEFIFLDEKGIVKDNDSIRKGIESNFSYIARWLKLNKRSLVAANQTNNIGYGLTQLLNSDSICLTPAFFDDDLLATILTGKRKGSFKAAEAGMLEKYAILLSFAISNIRTRKLNAALESRLLQAQKLETIGKLSSGMAHDFSNLLSSIFGSVNLLRSRVPEAENVTRLIDNIETCSIRARDLTKGLLSFGKPTPKRKELIHPNHLLEELAKVVSQTFPSSITFEQNIDKDLHNILGNGTEVYQILLNLCVNAKEAISKKGQITLAAKNVTVDESNMISYPLFDKGNYVHFSVSDTGSGIEEENIQKIFEPYFSTKQKETGSGLGLYVTYGIIKAHNGHVEVSSELNKGTTFDVYIPAFELTKKKKTEDPGEKIIMLADDEEMLRDLLAELLEANGYNVIRVNSGEEALKVLTEEIKVDLLIIDYNMPVMNGLDCIKELREKNFRMPVILSSGSLKYDVSLSDKYNINSTLQKPYEFDTMLSTIKKLI